MNEKEYEPQELLGTESKKQVLSNLRIFEMLLLILLATYVHSTNMFAFPHYQDAEGTSIANAEAVIYEGDFSPYTYAYEESPLVTIVLAGWGNVTDGFESFGFPINSGRVLMLVVRLLCVMLVYAITFKLTGSNVAAIFATLVFIFSPLAISLQRRVLGDNIMLFFFLASLFLIVGEDRGLYHYFGSALYFALAVLAKMNIIMLMPAFIFIIALMANSHIRRFAVSLWVVGTLIVISIFPLYAQMREELFPQGWWFGGEFPHVSLVDRILDRGPEQGFLFAQDSSLLSSFGEWTQLQHLTADPVLIFGGLIAVLFMAVMANDNKSLRPLIAITMMFALAVILSGRVVVSDILPMLPVFAMCIGIVIALVSGIFSGFMGKVAGPVVQLVIVVILSYPFWAFYINRVDTYVTDQVSGQLEAIEWAEENLPHDAFVITDNYAFSALRDTFDNSHHYWKVDTDPDVKFTLLEDNSCNIDFVIVTPQVQADIDIYNLDLMRRTLDDSDLIRSYENNGWPIEIYQVNQTDCDTLIELTSDTGN